MLIKLIYLGIHCVRLRVLEDGGMIQPAFQWNIILVLSLSLVIYSFINLLIFLFSFFALQ